MVGCFYLNGHMLYCKSLSRAIEAMGAVASREDKFDYSGTPAVRKAAKRSPYSSWE